MRERKCPRHSPRPSPLNVYCFCAPRKAATDTLPTTEANVGPSRILVIARSLGEFTKKNRSNSTQEQSSRHVYRGSDRNARSCRVRARPLSFDFKANLAKENRRHATKKINRAFLHLNSIFCALELYLTT